SAGDGGDNWGTQTVVTDATLTGGGTSADPLSVNGDLTDDQTLSILGNDLTISDGNTVTLPVSPSDGDAWGVAGEDKASAVSRTGNVGIGVSNPLSPLHIFTQDSEIARFESTASSNMIGFYQDSNRKGILWNAGDNMNLYSDNGGLGFFTNGNNQRVKIDVSGNVGINTNSPEEKLHVVGTVRISDGTQGTGKVLTSDGLGNASWQILPASGSQWNTTGSNIYYNEGNVGIGLTNPVAPLVIYDPVIPRMSFQDNFSGTTDLDGLAIGVNFGAYMMNQENSDLFFGTNNNRVVTIKNDGKIGINTINPVEALDIVGTVMIEDGTEGAGKVLTSDAIGRASWQTPSGSSDGDAWGVTGEDQAGVITRTGSVGIGTSNPQSKLSVGGGGDLNSVISGVTGQYGENAVYGASQSGTGSGKGGYFVTYGDAGTGVFGKANSNTGYAIGGYFSSQSEHGKGVFGEGNLYGVNGLSYSNDGIGVYGEESATSGINYGGKFSSASNSGFGLAAESPNWGGLFSNNSNSVNKVFLGGSTYALRIEDGNQGAGKVLTSDGNGNASWQTPAGSSDGDAWGVDGEDKDSYVTRNGKVGIGTNFPFSRLSVGGGGYDGFAISGIESQADGVGVYGESSNSSGNGIGGRFVSLSSNGIGAIGSSPNWGGYFNNTTSLYNVYVAGKNYAMKIHDGNQGEGKVLTSDAEGNASWQDLPAAAGDNWGNQVIYSYSSLTGNGTFASPLDVNGDLTDDQTLSISGNNLSISGGNTVTLPISGGADGDAWNVNGEDQTSNIGRTGRVGIGTTSPEYLLHVQGSSSSGGVGYFRNTISSSDQYGVYGQCSNSDYYGYGGYFKGGYTGVLGIVQPSGGSSYIGVYGRANGGSGNKYGLRGQATGSGTNYGVFGEATGGTNNYGIYCSGNGVYTGTWSQSSDKKLKKNFNPVTNALEKVIQLQPKYFDYRVDEFPEMNLPQNRQMGFIAQEVQEVLPELVHSAIHISSDEKDSESIEYLTVDYVSIIPVLTAAVQELNKLVNEKQVEIDALQIQNEQILQRLEKLEQMFEASIDN
ncbi:MAG: tail fiber domain-containing protein, partial [Prolixibacteraceae bacterium]|nr:tail fiber domain-containing protein [Prolixibacteraceae bacterium]